MQTQKFPEEGFVRLNQILAPQGPIPISKSTWWKGVRNGTYPKSHKISANVTAWRAKDIREFMDKDKFQ